MDLKSYPKLKHVSDNTLVTIDRSKFSIGRSLNCNYILSLNEVSRVHCIFELESDGDNINWVLRDTSSNGTYVNNVLLKGTISKPLKNGDLIAIGSPQNTYCFLCYEKPVELTDDELLAITDTLIEEIKDPQNIEKLKDPQNIEELKDPQNNINDIPIKKFKGDIVQTSDHNYHSINNLENHSVSEEVASTSNLTPVEQTGAKVGNSGAKNDIIKQDDVEDELQCSICSELFIKAVTLNCSHSFCKFCIEQWRKNSNICPICRGNITSVAPTIVLDNFISKVLLSVSDDQKEARTKVIEERDKLTQGPSNKNNNVPNQPTTSNAADVIEILSEGESSDNYDSDYDDDDYAYDYDYDNDYDGLPGVYYGGYGKCYACGQTGHWANGCPFRRR